MGGRLGRVAGIESAVLLVGGKATLVDKAEQSAAAFILEIKIIDLNTWLAGSRPARCKALALEIFHTSFLPVVTYIQNN